jgi:hypothetical protein
MDYYLRGEECLTSLRFKQDASLRGAKLLLEQCPSLHAHLVVLRDAPPQLLPRSLTARPPSVVPPARLTIEDLFPTTARGALNDDEGPRSIAPQAPSTGPAAFVPNELSVPSIITLSSDTRSVVGRRCCKRFEGDPSRVYFGTIATHSAPPVSDSQVGSENALETHNDVWAVKYDDGDSENWDVEAVHHGLALFERLHDQDEHPAPAV